MAKKPVKSEKETKEHLLGWARKYGCEADLLKIFSRYEDLIKGCRTPEEKKAVATMGIVEIHEFFSGKKGGLVVNDEIIKDDISLHNKELSNNDFFKNKKV